MKSRSKCKICCGSGKITAAIDGGHFSHRATTRDSSFYLKAGQSHECPYCEQKGPKKK